MCAKWREETISRKGEEFEAIAAPFKGHTLQELETSYFAARHNKDDLDAQLKPINQVIAVLELLIAERMAEDDLKTVTFDNGNRINLRLERPRSVGDREAFVAWLKATGREFELSCNYQSMKRICGEYFEEAGKLPDGIVEGDPQPIITYTRRKA
jgi:hypothetical protein